MSTTVSTLIRQEPWIEKQKYYQAPECRMPPWCLSLLLEQLPEEEETKNLLTQVRGGSLTVLEIYVPRMWLAHVESVSFVA